MTSSRYDATLSSAAQQRHILGLQADIWTEHMQTEQRVEWMALPRAAALAEVGWSPQQRSWPDFLKRLAPMFARYRALGIDYADSVFGIESDVRGDAGGIQRDPLESARTHRRRARCRDSLHAGRRRAELCDRLRYSQPLEPCSPARKFAPPPFSGSEQVSRIFAAHLDSHSVARRTSHQLELCSNGIGLLLEPSAGGGPGRAVCGRYHESVLDLSRRRSDAGTAIHGRRGAAAVQL